MTDQVDNAGESGNEVTFTPTQQEALENGWVPKEEFKGDPEKWVEAAEYLRRGELFKKIELQSRELKDMRQALLGMKKLHADVAEVEYRRALDTLKAQKKDALEKGDADAVIAADERIDLIREHQRQANAEVSAPTAGSGDQHPVFVDWVSRNSWYQSHTAMRAYADAIGAELAGRGVPPEQVLKEVEKEVRKEFPQRFQNQKQSRPSSVEGGVKTTAAQSKDSFVLTPEERKIMTSLVKNDVMTEAEYIRDLKKIKGIA